MSSEKEQKKIAKNVGKFFQSQKKFIVKQVVSVCTMVKKEDNISGARKSGIEEKFL